MKFFKNKKLIIILLCILAACITLCTVLYFAPSKTNEEKNGALLTSQSEAEDGKTEIKAYENKADINEGKGPVNIDNGDDIVEKIDKFNSLNDGDEEKEKIRKELEDLFAYAEGTTLN
jgi:hypothetical protein